MQTSSVPGFIIHHSSFILGGSMARSTHGKVTPAPTKETAHPPVSKTPSRDGGHSPTQPPLAGADQSTTQQTPEAPSPAGGDPRSAAGQGIGWWWVPIAVWVLCLLFLFGVDLVALIYRAFTASPP
jgi:hypothetical protein